MQKNPTPSFVLALSLGSALFCATIIFIVLWNQGKINRLTYELTAEAYSTSISTFRDFYSKVILDRVHTSEIDITHDYLSRENAVPIPATMTLDLAQFLNGRNANVNLRIVSEYPFPWRAQRKLSGFEERALGYFMNRFGTRYSELQDDKDAHIFQFATPIQMTQACVDCHNSHPDSPKLDWKIGDIRGLQIVSLDPRQIQTGNRLEGAYYVVIATLLFFAFTFSVIFWLISKNNLSLRLLNRETEQHLKAREAAERSNQVKSRFLAVVSHEMRTPLNAVEGMLREIRYSTSDQRILEMTKVAHASSDMLCNLIEDVIDVTRLENDKFAFNGSDFDVAVMLDEVVSLLSDRAKLKGVAIGFTDSGLSHRFIHSDRARLKQVLVNLVGNAIKFTDVGEINVIASMPAGSDGTAQLKIDVRDTGKGIGALELRNIFKRFYQSRIGDGLGLGLWISQDIVKRMGGRILVESAEGRGSTFTVELPVTLAEKADYTFDDKITGFPLDGLHLLVAEDNSTNRYVIDRIVQRLGGTVDFAENGKIAVEKARAGTYDLILMDINMPVMDGLTAFAEIRRRAGQGAAPVVALTANALPEHIAEYLGIGMSACVTKPIEEFDLIRSILTVLGKTVPEFVSDRGNRKDADALTTRQKSAVEGLMAAMDDD